MYWVIDFLTNREHNDCFSNSESGVYWECNTGRRPTRHKIRPVALRYNDCCNGLNVSGVDDRVKYVDDSTMSEFVGHNESSILR
jgi:hypothetical protein